MRRALAVAAAVVPLLVLPAAPSFADDAAAAQQLHDDAKKLIADNNWSAACPKLEESYRLSPAIGTRYKLADCFQHTGRTASAWAHFVGVASAAKAAGQADREKEARARAAALEPKLSRLAIVVPEATRVAGLEVKRDGQAIGAAQWGEALPIDPGAHEVTASAPGKRAYRAQMEIGGDASTTKVIVPPLEDAAKVDVPPPTPSATTAPTTTAPPPPPPPPADGPSRKTVGWALVGAGGASLVGGTVFWILRGSKVSSLESACGAGGRSCPASATGDIADGKTYNALGIGLFAVGTACVALGAGVLLTGGKEKTSASAHVVPVAGGAPGLGVVGRW